VEEAKKFAKDNKVDLRSIELDVTSQASVDAPAQDGAQVVNALTSPGQILKGV
jgi:hypothetical protein